VLQQVLDWLAADDLAAATDLVCTIAARHPDRLDQYAAALIRAGRDPTPLSVARLAGGRRRLAGERGAGATSDLAGGRTQRAGPAQRSAGPGGPL
jgi:hypothetical protein